MTGQTCLRCDTAHNVDVYDWWPEGPRESGRTPMCRSCWKAVESGGYPLPVPRTRGGDGR